MKQMNNALMYIALFLSCILCYLLIR